jgi:hypothetical protein
VLYGLLGLGAGLLGLGAGLLGITVVHLGLRKRGDKKVHAGLREEAAQELDFEADDDVGDTVDVTPWSVTETSMAAVAATSERSSVDVAVAAHHTTEPVAKTSVAAVAAASERSVSSTTTEPVAETSVAAVAAASERSVSSTTTEPVAETSMEDEEVTATASERFADPAPSIVHGAAEPEAASSRCAPCVA